MKTIPLTVLAHEGPQLRAYLSRLRHTQLRVSRILLMVQKRHPATHKPVGRWMPRLLRIAYAEKIQDLAENYWPRRIHRQHPWLVSAISAELGTITEDAGSIIDEMLGPFRYELYAETVDRVLIENLRDPALTAALAASRGAVLFTGGGILRSNLLNQPRIRFLHIHPGTLPNVRGADGLLWSMLVRGRPGISCFYMASGIDTGGVITTHDFPALTIDITGHARPDDQLLYRALLSFCDPLLRAELFASRIVGQGDLDSLSQTPQNESDGVTYHFLHPDLRTIALERIFRS